jgi:hypothetical protein
MKRHSFISSVALGVAIAAIILAAIIAISWSKISNKQLIDTKWKFNKAIIEGVGEVYITSWNDYDESDMIQVTTDDGTTYLTHSSNVILISE